MKGKAVARRLDDIHNIAIRGDSDVAISELRKFRLEVKTGGLDTYILAQFEQRIDEMEVYIFMSSPNCAGDLIKALVRMVESIKTEDTRKIETISLGLGHLQRIVRTD
jgi:hypothetical protein